jgi:hypothetical protein
MKPEVITAILAAVVAIMSATVSIYGQTRIAQLTDQLAKRREIESREAQTAALMSKYRDPLLRSAIDLQSRLYNIHQQFFLGYFYNQSHSAKEYAITNTLYVIAEYLGWVEILRREIQFLDLGDSTLNRRLSVLLVNINQAFSRGKFGGIFQLFNGEQRAIGEVMTVTRSIEGVSRYDCMGYATFVKNMRDTPEFSDWFLKLREDINTIATTHEAKTDRIALIQSNLIDLIDFLDPERVVVPPKYRTKIEPHIRS